MSSLRKRLRADDGDVGMLIVKLVGFVLIAGIIVYDLATPMFARFAIDNHREQMLEKANAVLAANNFDASAAYPILADALKQSDNVRLVKVATSPTTSMQGAKGTVTLTVEKSADSVLGEKLMPDYYTVSVDIDGPIR